MFPQIFGKYVLERPLAVGGMARVFLATLRGAGGFEKKLVLKQIRTELATDEAFVRRFVEEAKTTVELSHPNIVPVYELGAEQGVYYLAMELCDGVTLAELLAETGRLGPAEGAYVGIEICRALDYAHRKARIIHRDVTPRNVLIDEEGAVRLIDFGIAAPAFAGAREVFGSPGHMPPEQLAGQELGPATDVFAVATLLYEAWSNDAPFRRESPEASERALHEPLPPVSQIDRSLGSLDALIASALSLEPAKRPQSAEELSRPLRRFLADSDFGDIARRLGARVRATREAQPAPSLADDMGSPSETSSVTSVTHTFATRTAGAAPVPSKAPASDMATRRMSRDPPSAAVVTPPRWTTARWLFAAALAAGLATAIGWQPWRHADVARAAPRAVTPVVNAMELPAPTSERALTPAPIQPDPMGQAETTDRRATTGPAETPPNKPEALLSSPPDPARPTPARPDSSARPAPSAHGDVAHVRVTATPPAVVEIDGRSRGATPVTDLALAPGAHLVRLSCGALGEAVSQNLHLEAGETLIVSGDFTGVRGRILVRRASP